MCRAEKCSFTEKCDVFVYFIQTKREYVKDLIKEIQKEIPFAKDRIFSAITHPERYNLFDKAYNNQPYWNKDKK